MSLKQVLTIWKLVPFIVRSTQVVGSEDREKYIASILMDFLSVNSVRGLTIDDLMKATKFNRRTISSHLEIFVARGEVYKEFRGRTRIFHTNGQTVGKPVFVKNDQDDHYFRLYRLANDDGKFVYVQEREMDDFNRDKVKGVVKIRDDEIQDFIKKLHAFAVTVTQDE